MDLISFFRLIDWAKIKVLNLSNCSFSNDGIKALYGFSDDEISATAKTLTSLDLSQNNFSQTTLENFLAVK